MRTLLPSWLQSLADYENQLKKPLVVPESGSIVRATGLVMEAKGLTLPVGTLCRVERHDRGQGAFLESEVVGFSGNHLFLMPLENIGGIRPGAKVYRAGPRSGDTLYPLGSTLLGRVLDSRGVPLDGRPLSKETTFGSLVSTSLSPLERTPITQILDVGVRAINGLLTVGEGQRMGLFAGSGVGKSVLLGMMARYTCADVIVVGLIGERGREVKEFIENILGEEGLSRAVVVAAPADVSPILRLQGAQYATRIAEDFRDNGLKVLLIMDSLTRYAMAQREIALAIGEPPATKGYPPSVFAKLPALVERAGNGSMGRGSITAFYTVLSEGDDQQDPVADASRAILDGHIVLSRSLAESGHYPAIDIDASVSRVMTALISAERYQVIQSFRQQLSAYQNNSDLIHVGAYVAGTNPLVDRAITHYPAMMAYLKQSLTERSHYTEDYQKLGEVFTDAS